MASAFQPNILVKRLTEFAVIPTRGSPFAAGLDLSSAYDGIVPARGKALLKTDLSVAIPPNSYARVAPRSGLCWKHSIDVGAGVIDYDYRGNVCVILFNFGDQDFVVNRGDRIAQLIIERIHLSDVVEVNELPSTERGDGGFGSTGISQSTKKSRAECDNDCEAAISHEEQETVVRLVCESLAGVKSHFASHHLTQQEFDAINHQIISQGKHAIVCGILRASNNADEFKSLILHLIN